MRKNGIEVLIKSASGETLEEIPGPLGSSRSAKSHLKVTPGEEFSIKVTVLEHFKWSRFRNVYIEYHIDNHEMDDHLYPPRIQKPANFKFGKYPLHWEKSVGRCCNHGDGEYYFKKFAFGRNMGSKSRSDTVNAISTFTDIHRQCGSRQEQT